MRRDDAPGGAGTDRCRQNAGAFSAHFCQCLRAPAFRNVTDSNEAVPVRHSTSDSPFPEELPVSTYSRPHLSLVPGWGPTPAPAPAPAPVPSPWTDLSPAGDASWRL